MKKGVSAGIVIIASLIIGLLVFVILVAVLNINVTGGLSDIFTAFRAGTGSSMSVKAALYQCELKCLNLDGKYDASSISDSAFCTFAIEIDGQQNHCYMDFPNDPLIYACETHYSDGSEVIVSC